MEELRNLKNHLLIAMPALEDSWFAGTVTYLCEHNADGAMGIVLSKPSPHRFSEVCEQLGIDGFPGHEPVVLQGGPVQPEQGFILHRDNGQHWGSTMAVTDEISLSSSRDILEAIASASGPDEYRFALGYAGWGADQLEHELTDNAWLTLPATPELVFGTTAETIHSEALKRFGISVANLSHEAGHA
ncbi:MAG TPA: YqgE/AlgH family protein [Oceanospirillales bacterium]|nr:YqgE/AlgH family protein [Oceanospirillaceae bacterium]HBS43232.1 YqgE/AlgH family protein [Oceanospirillales bacterium]|tara:strand:- start:3940 stop:4500 length:561 start_codon:yes stop_codon:yes gene_type:complete